MSPSYVPSGWCRACGYRIEPGVCPECGRRNDVPLSRDPRLARRRLRRIALAVVALSTCAAATWFWRDELAVRFVPLGLLTAISDGNSSARSWAWLTIKERSRRRYLAEKPRLEATRAAIAAELAADDVHEWAGWYKVDPTELLLSPGGRFAFHKVIHGCFTTQVGHTGNDGVVASVRSDRIQLRPRIDPRLFDFWCPTGLVRVTWRGVPLLVHPEDVEYFCRRVNAGQPLDALTWVYRRKGKRFEHTSALPIVPPEFERCLLREPILLRVLELGSEWTMYGSYVIEARLDRGSCDGLIEYTDVFRDGVPVGDGVERAVGTITELGAYDCVVEFRVDMRHDAECEWPQVGWVCTTRDPEISDEEQFRQLDEFVAADTEAPATP